MGDNSSDSVSSPSGSEREKTPAVDWAESPTKRSSPGRREDDDGDEKTGAGRDEWVLILSMWPNDEGGFDRPVLERFDDREKAEDIRQKYAVNDGLHTSDYTVIRREKVDTLPFGVSFDNCGDDYLAEGGSA